MGNLTFDEEKIQLKKLIAEHSRIVFFGGAGVSTESGIPDFRSVDGLYNQKYDYPPETILSHSFFKGKMSEFYRFYKDKMLCLDAKPNSAHYALASLEKSGKLSSVITQNIDGLHQLAGSENVVELHGSVLRNYCMSCGKAYSAEYILNSDGIPKCECGGNIKPDVVLYEEQLDSRAIETAIMEISAADMLMVGGTSLAVYPAAGMIRYFKGKTLVLINKSETQYDGSADYVFRSSIGKLLGAAVLGE